jgi:GTP-binding protein Era
MMTGPDKLQANLPADTRCGYVTLLGRPNAGKSTLLNALVEERLSIVTPKAQTTWQRITAIHTREDAQMIFLDTPGLLDPRDLLQRSMLSSALEALAEADVLLLVWDATRPLDPRETKPVTDALDRAPDVPLLVAVNKVDATGTAEKEAAQRWVREELDGEVWCLSALQGEGVDGLRERLSAALPPGPFLYPADEIARDPVRFFVAEMIRETVFERFHQEIPYSVFCTIEEFREREDPIYIQAQLFVERNSQKRILVGRKGSSIRALGSASREKIEAFLGRRVYLDLWVKVLPNWRRKRGHLRSLGFSVPPLEPAGRS